MYKIPCKNTKKIWFSDRLSTFFFIKLSNLVFSQLFMLSFWVLFLFFKNNC